MRWWKRVSRHKTWDSGLPSMHMGRSFTAVTEHRALEWMNRMKRDKSRLT